MHRDAALWLSFATGDDAETLELARQVRLQSLNTGPPFSLLLKVTTQPWEDRVRECAMTAEVVVGILGAAATIVAGVLGVILPTIIGRWKPSTVQQYKFAYVKLHHLSRKVEGKPPLFKRYVDRLGEDVDVYDEVHLFRLNIFFKQQADFTTRDRSSGVVDLQILYPWDRLSFPDPGEGKVPGHISQTFRQRSRVFFTQTTRYNGFQPGNEDVLARMETDVEEMRM